MNHRFTVPTLAAVLVTVPFAACSKSGTNAVSTPTGQPAPAAASAPAPAGAATYTISISPAWKVGQKFDYVGDDVSVSDGKTHVHFEAEGEVLALLPSGTPQKLAYTVKVLRVTGADIPSDSLPGVDGKIVIEYLPDGKRSVTFNDKPAEQDAADCLQAVLWLSSRNHTDQEIFGPRAPVAVGANWPVNAKAFTDFDEENEVHFTSIEGTLNLQSVDGAGDSRVAVVSGVLMVKGQNPPSEPGSFAGLLNFTASAPVGTSGVFKETELTKTTITPPADMGDKPMTEDDTTVQEITMR